MVAGGWEADPAEVDAIVGWLLEVTDAAERYDRAAAAQALYETVVTELGRIRARSLAQMHIEGLSYGRIAERTGMTRSRAQQLVERGRET